MTSLKRPTEADALTERISNKIIVRTLRNGKVQKITREVYLRTDIPCSSQLCKACQEAAPRDASSKALKPVLSDSPAHSEVFPDGRYLFPDAKVLMDGVELFETSEEFFSDVVVLQTVLEELRNRSLPIYNRLVGLIERWDRSFYVFFNEFHLETHLSRIPGESVGDYNGRAIRRAVAWYKDHLKRETGKRVPPAMVMLTDDADNQAKGKSEALHALGLVEYVEELLDADQLLDMIPDLEDGDPTKAKSGSGSTSGSGPGPGPKTLYDDYYTFNRLDTGIRSGMIHKGVFRVSPYNYLEGSVRVPAFRQPLLVVGRENCNRAFDGDEVSVEVLPRAQWKQPSARIIEEETLTRNENADDADGDEAEDLTSEKERRALLQEAVKKAHNAGGGGDEKGRRGPQPTAKVVGIRKSGRTRPYVGYIDPTSVAARAKSSSQGRRSEFVFVTPMDKRIPKIRLRTRQAGQLLGQRLLVAIDNWPRDSRHPVGHLVRAIGVFETKAAETEALLLEHGIEYRRFAKEVLDCLPPEGHDWRVPEDRGDPAWRQREDLRHLVVCSIDPIGCQDIDDALHARPLDNGNFEVGVHIADVTHFVQAGTKMDEQASVRATTVYLVDKRIDMLPPLLGTDLCSLRPRVDRLAFSVLWELAADAQVVGVRFTKSVIRSREAFSYEDAQLRIDDPSRGGDDDDELTTGMRTLLALSKKLKQGRMEAGALSLSSPEVKVQVESETSDPIDVNTKELLDTNSLVEEFMLLANISVAKRIHEAWPDQALLRRHAAPPSHNFDELAAQLKARRGVELRFGTSRELADSLDRCVDPSEPFFNTLVRILATRCMMSAEYFVSSSAINADTVHYGLATPIYTHFTSPIRRYADVIVHRQLAAAIGFDEQQTHLLPSTSATSATSAFLNTLGTGKLFNRGQLEPLCGRINGRHRNAQLAGRASVAYYVGQALRNKWTDEDAFIMRVFSNGFVAFVPRFGIEGLVRLRDLAEPEPASSFDSDRYELMTSGSRKLRLTLFGQVRVRVSDDEDKPSGKRGVKIELLEGCK